MTDMLPADANRTYRQPGAALDVNQGLVTKKAMGKRVKLPNGDVMTEAVMDVEVHMYVNKPGVFYDSKARVLPDAVAAQAGFDVKKEAKKRAKFQERERVMAEIAEVVVEQEREVIEERGGFKLVEIGEGRFTVADMQDMDFMEPNNEEIARAFFNSMAGEPVVEAEDVLVIPQGTFKREGKNAKGEGVPVRAEAEAEG